MFGRSSHGDPFISQTSGLQSPAFSLNPAALAEDAAQHAGNGEDELAVGNGLAEGFGDPVAGGADAALVAGRADVATLAGEG